MKLRSEFEITRSNLMNRDSSPSLDVCFGELLREERLVTQGSFMQDNSGVVAFAAQGRGRGQSMGNVQSYSCKEYGQMATNCKKKFCNYYKQQGHFIKECSTRPQNRRVNVFPAVLSSNLYISCNQSSYFRNGTTNDSHGFLGLRASRYYFRS